MALQEPDYLDLNKANGKLDPKAGRKDDDARSDSNVRLHKPIDIVRPASAEGQFPFYPYAVQWTYSRIRFTLIAIPYESFVPAISSSSTIRRLDTSTFVNGLTYSRRYERTLIVFFKWLFFTAPHGPYSTR